MSMKHRRAVGAVGAITLGEVALIHLGRTYGSTKAERTAALPGDRIVSDPKVVTNHAITIDAPPSAVWPWLVQMGWGRGGWYTARWVDRLLFPANGPSADRIMPELQDIEVGTFIPDGAPATECGLFVEEIERERALVLHSNSHLPMRWRAARNTRLVVGLRPHAARWRAPHPLPLPVEMDNAPVVVDRRGLARDRSRRLRDVEGHASRGQDTCRAGFAWTSGRGVRGARLARRMRQVDSNCRAGHTWSVLRLARSGTWAAERTARGF